MVQNDKYSKHLFLRNEETHIQFQWFFFFWLCWVFVAARGLSLVAPSGGLLFVVVHGFLITVASLAVEHGLQARRLQQLWCTGSVVVARGLQSAGSVVVVYGLSCSMACGIFPDQGSNPCPRIGRWILNHCATREVPVPMEFFDSNIDFYFGSACVCLFECVCACVCVGAGGKRKY